MGRVLFATMWSAILFDENRLRLSILSWNGNCAVLKTSWTVQHHHGVMWPHDLARASTFADKNRGGCTNDKSSNSVQPRELFEKSGSLPLFGYFIGIQAELLWRRAKRHADFWRPLKYHHGAMLNAFKSHECQQTSKIGIRPEFVHVWDGKNNDALFPVESGFL